jgi:hypothetical protein
MIWSARLQGVPSSHFLLQVLRYGAVLARTRLSRGKLIGPTIPSRAPGVPRARETFRPHLRYSL